MMRFRGKVHKDGGNTLKIVFEDGVPRGLQVITITKAGGRATHITFQATVTYNDTRRLKTRLPFPAFAFPELRPGTVVEGRIEDAGLRCKWCGAKVSALLNGFCDDCFEYFNSPYKPF